MDSDSLTPGLENLEEFRQDSYKSVARNDIEFRCLDDLYIHEDRRPGGDQRGQVI